MDQRERGPFVAIAALCDLVIEDKANVLSLIRVVDRVDVRGGAEAPDVMPPQPIATTVVLAFKAGEARGVFALRLRLQNPGGDTQDLLDTPVAFEEGGTGINILVNLRFVAQRPGTYWIDVRLNDGLMSRIPLEVRYLRQPPMRPE